MLFKESQLFLINWKDIFKNHECLFPTVPKSTKLQKAVSSSKNAIQRAERSNSMSFFKCVSFNYNFLYTLDLLVMPKETNTYHISWTYFSNAIANKRHKSLQAQLTIDSFFYESIIFSSRSLWNWLPDAVINATSSDLFTKKLNAHIFNVSFSWKCKAHLMFAHAMFTTL